MSGETIDGGGPYEFDKALEETQTEYREALDRLDDGNVNYRSAETGQFVSEEEAEAHPETTVKETVDPTPEEMDAMVDKAVALVTEHQGVNPKGNPTKLNKRSVLLNLVDGDNDFATFAHLNEDGSHSDIYKMTLDMWDDFGRPDTITLVAYPRDILN